MSETAGLEDYRAQLGDAAATSVVEVHKGKARVGRRILQERDCRGRRQAMLTAQMQKSVDKAVAPVSVIITAARPVAVVGKKLEHKLRRSLKGHFRQPRPPIVIVLELREVMADDF